MKKQLTRVCILRSARIVTALYVVMGLFYSLIGVPMLVFGGEKMKIMAIVYLAMPVFMGVLGFIFFAIFAALYNLLAGWVGGIEVEVSDVP